MLFSSIFSVEYSIFAPKMKRNKLAQTKIEHQRSKPFPLVLPQTLSCSSHPASSPRVVIPQITSTNALRNLGLRVQ